MDNCCLCHTPEQIDDEGVLRLLYEEARGNILTGRYPCDPEHWTGLGALSLALDEGTGLDEQHFTTTIRYVIKVGYKNVEQINSGCGF